MARYVCAMLLKMKEVFQVIESMKRAAVIEDYAVARAVGALFYVEPFSTADIDFLVRLPLSNGLLVSLEPIHSWLLSKGYRMDSGIQDGFRRKLYRGKMADPVFAGNR